MDIRIKIKPRIVTGRTKADVDSKISTLVGGYRISTGGRVNQVGDVIGINYQKFRKRVKRTPKKTVVTRVPHWVAYVYIFPIVVIHTMGYKEISQKKRYFRFR